MQTEEIINAQNYLLTFDNILNQMQNKMLSQKINQDITLDFIRCMIPHHQAAIYMCENLLKYTKQNSLINIANSIIRMQTDGIKQMQYIAKTTTTFPNSISKVDCYMYRYNEIVNSMLFEMRNSVRCTNINLDFINEMIPHHAGAISMCSNLLEFNIDPRLVKVAKSIINSSTQGSKKYTLL